MPILLRWFQAVVCTSKFAWPAAFGAEILSLTGMDQKVISGDWALNIGGNKNKQEYLRFTPESRHLGRAPLFGPHQVDAPQGVMPKGSPDAFTDTTPPEGIQRSETSAHSTTS